MSHLQKESRQPNSRSFQLLPGHSGACSAILVAQLLFLSTWIAQLDAQESPKFSAAVAPILLQNCNGCHLGGQRASGGLNMNSFASLMRGGSSGAAILPRQPDESLLVRKLTGEASGQRMPAGGRQPLSEENIEVIKEWIRQGATFDGSSEAADIKTIVQQNSASNATHDELFQQRQQRALERWKQVIPDVAPTVSSAEEFFVLGNVDQARLALILEHFQRAAKDLKKQAKLPVDQPLIRGGLVLNVLHSRYDYSEFGRMAEKRELPRQWVGHWQVDSLDARLVLCDDSSQPASLAAIASQLVTGAYWGSLPEVPYWFAEGVARNFVASKHRRNDPRVNQWLSELPLVNQRIGSPSELLEGKLDEETQGLAGMAITQWMMSRTNRTQYMALAKMLTKQTTFPEAMMRTFGAPETMVKSWLAQ
jgi:hypothetical protein